MKVLQLQNIQREEGQIFYLRRYTCDAVLQLISSEEKVPIKFSVESDFLGKRTIELSFIKTVNYPIIPLKKALIQFIITEDLEGRLPC